MLIDVCMGSVNIVPSPHDSSAIGYSYNLPLLSTSISTASSGSSLTSSQSSSISTGNNRAETSCTHLVPITTNSSVLSPLPLYDSPHPPHSPHPHSAMTTDFGMLDVSIKVELPTVSIKDGALAGVSMKGQRPTPKLQQRSDEK